MQAGWQAVRTTQQTVLTCAFGSSELRVFALEPTGNPSTEFDRQIIRNRPDTHPVTVECDSISLQI